MSLPVIDDMVEAVGYIEWFMNYYFKIPNMDLSNGLKHIQKQQFLKFMEVTVPSKVVIEEISSSEEDVGPTTLKPIRYKGLLAIEGPKVDDCCTSQVVQTCVSEVGEINAEEENGQKEKNYEGPDKSKGKFMAEVGEEDTEGDVGEGDTESEYGSDTDNLVFSKFDERDSEQRSARQSEQRSARQSEQSREREEEQSEEEFDTVNVEQNMVDDPDYNSDALESVHSSDDE
ncbi:hypothetical protein ACFXTN_007272 [Malus domestica]